jgi:hypothetical protein
MKMMGHFEQQIHSCGMHVIYLPIFMEENDARNGENADGDPLWLEIVIPCFTEHKIE